MKKFFFPGLLLFSLASIAQSPDYLIGCHWTGSQEITRHLDLSSGNYSNLQTIPLVSGIVQGETAYDQIGLRYFLSTDKGVAVINASNGNLITMLTNPQHLKGIEYQQATGKLVGTFWNGTAEVFASMNVSTGAITSIAILQGVQSVVQGETSFDVSANIYFTRVNTGILAINANSGTAIVIPGSSDFFCAQYNPNSGELAGCVNFAGARWFASKDIVTGNITPIAIIQGIGGFVQGECTFDVSGNRYFFRSDAGIHALNALSGVVLSTYPGIGSLGGIEYIGSIVSCSAAASLLSPAQVTAQTSSAVSFSVLPGVSNAAIQWQTLNGNTWTGIQNSSFYSGANGPVLILNGVSQSHHLSQYRAMVSFNNCTGYSGISTLFVLNPENDDDSLDVPGSPVQGIAQNPPARAVLPFPNPVIRCLNFSTGASASEGFIVRILNSRGQLVYKAPHSGPELSLDISGLEKGGVFTVQLIGTGDDIIRSGRFITAPE
jgi:hypothetical protein